MMQDMKYEAPDIIFASEIRGSPLEEKSTKIAARTLRLMMFAMGYKHIAWNWCVDSPHTLGTAIFSKIPWSKIEFGTTNGSLDKQGRTITVYIAGIAAVCTYSPCSSMGTEDPAKERRRYDYDVAYRKHFQKVQTEVGSNAVLGCGDYNVAPTERHIDRKGVDWRNIPSTKGYEHSAYNTFTSAAAMEGWHWQRRAAPTTPTSATRR